MLSLEWANALARYNRWMNDKLLAVVATLSDEDRKRDQAAFFGSIHGTFNHLLLADRIWLGRLRGEQPAEGCIGPDGIRTLDQELYSDFDTFRRERAKTDDAWSTYIAGLTEDRLAGDFEYTRRGQTQSAPVWWAVATVLNHQTHHRGQITTLLKQQGVDPGVTDLVAMLREEASAG